MQRTPLISTFDFHRHLLFKFHGINFGVRSVDQVVEQVWSMTLKNDGSAKMPIRGKFRKRIKDGVEQKVNVVIIKVCVHIKEFTFDLLRCGRAEGSMKQYLVKQACPSCGFGETNKIESNERMTSAAKITLETQDGYRI